jgi:hypothetical protein
MVRDKLMYKKGDFKRKNQKRFKEVMKKEKTKLKEED